MVPPSMIRTTCGFFAGVEIEIGAPHVSNTTAPRHAFEVVLDTLVVNRDDIVQWTRCSVGHPELT
jgi:hypothetical protein